MNTEDRPTITEIRQATEGHHLDEAVKVGLVLRDGAWAIDGDILGGYALESALDYPSYACGCGNQSACVRAVHTANKVALPTAEELTDLLVLALATRRAEARADAEAEAERRAQAIDATLAKLRASLARP